MMKRSLFAVIAVGLILVCQPVLSGDEEAVRQQCEDQAVENNIDEAGFDGYVQDCVSYYQENDPQLQAGVVEEELEKAPTDQD